MDYNKAVMEAMDWMFFDGPKSKIKDGIRKTVCNSMKEEELSKIILEFSRMVEKDSLRDEIKNNVASIAKELRKRINNGDYQIRAEVRKIADEWLLDHDMDERGKERLVNAFFMMLLCYIEKFDKNLYNDICLRREIDVLKKDFEELKKSQELDFMRNRRRKILEDLENHLRSKASDTLHIEIDKIRKRTQDMKTLNEKYQNGQKVVFLYGDPGIGKTSLARMYANESEHTSIFFLTYDKSVENTLNNLIGNEIKADAEDVIRYFQNLSPQEKKGTLLIIDNFNDDDDQADDRAYDDELNGETFQKLAQTGIHLLITTRINVNANQMEVKRLEDIKTLFWACYGKDEEEGEDGQIDQLIRAVNGNTLLVVLLAYIWRDGNEERKRDLLRKLKDGQMQEEDLKLSIAADSRSSFGRKTFYRQLEEILHYSPVLKSEEKKKWMASAALLPLEGMEKERFLLAMKGLNVNELNDLIDRRWISLEGERIFVHAGIREVTRRNHEIVNYENCRQYCNAVCDMLDVDIEEKLYVRIACRTYGWQIYKVFPDVEDERLLWMYYNLSDIYDHLKEKQLAKEMVQKVLEQIEVFSMENVKLSRILSGTAYSLIQGAAKEEDLEKPKEMLDRARDILCGLPQRKSDVDWNKIWWKVSSNQGAFLQKEADLLKRDSQIKYETSRKQHEQTLEGRKEMLKDWQGKVEQKKFRELQSEVAISYKNLATEQFHLGQYDDYPDQYEEAIKNHKKAMEIYEAQGKKSSLAFSYKLVIGCWIAGYKKDLTIYEETLDDILEHYLEVLEVFWNNEQSKYLKEFLSSLQFINKIIDVDKRCQRYEEKIKELNEKVAAFLRSRDGLTDILIDGK